MLLVRSLNKSQMGTWALFLIVITIFEATKSALLKNAHVRYVSATGDRLERSVIASSSLLINASLSSIFILLLFFFSGQLGIWLHTGPDLSLMLKWFIPGLLLMIFFSHLEAIQQSHLDFKGIFAGYFTRQLTFFLIIAFHFFSKIPFSLVHLALYQSASILVGMIFLYVYSRIHLIHRFNPSGIWFKRILSYGGYIFGSGIMSNISANVDQIMTATFLSSSSVAYYNAASRINTFVDMPSFVAADILFPKSSRASVEEGPAKVKYLYERMVAVLLSITTPIALFIIIFPGLIIWAIAGSSYRAAAPILQMYMLAGMLRPMQNQAANLLNSIGKPGLTFYINAITVVVNIPVNYLCFRQFGFYGAAIGTLITLTLSTTVWYFIMKRQVGFEFKNVFHYWSEFYRKVYTQGMRLLTGHPAPKA
jgi:lipopolysaccharide exporter